MRKREEGRGKREKENFFVNKKQVLEFLRVLRVLRGFCAGFARVLRGFCAGFARVLRGFCAGFARVLRGFCAGFARVLRGFCGFDENLKKTKKHENNPVPNRITGKKGTTHLLLAQKNTYLCAQLILSFIIIFYYHVVIGISILFAVYSQFIRSLFAVYSQFIYSLFTVYLQFICSLFAVYLQFICSLFAVYSQFIRSLFAVYTQFIRSLDFLIFF
jgi:hypothetical protein